MRSMAEGASGGPPSASLRPPLRLAALGTSPASRGRISYRITSGLLPLVLLVANLAQQVAHVAGGAQFAADIGREAQIALGVEPAGFGVGRQFAQHLGESAEDGLDILCFEPPFASLGLWFRSHAALRCTASFRDLAGPAYQNSAS